MQGEKTAPFFSLLSLPYLKSSTGTKENKEIYEMAMQIFTLINRV